MFDIYAEVVLTTLTLMASVALFMSIQLFLCFKVKRLFIRLLPAGLLGAVCVWFLILSISVSGWDGLGYAGLAIYAALMFFACILGWGVWGICLWRGKKRKQ